MNGTRIHICNGIRHSVPNSCLFFHFYSLSFRFHLTNEWMHDFVIMQWISNIFWLVRLFFSVLLLFFFFSFVLGFVFVSFLSLWRRILLWKHMFIHCMWYSNSDSHFVSARHHAVFQHAFFAALLQTHTHNGTAYGIWNIAQQICDIVHNKILEHTRDMLLSKINCSWNLYAYFATYTIYLSAVNLPSTFFILVCTSYTVHCGPPDVASVWVNAIIER